MEMRADRLCYDLRYRTIRQPVPGPVLPLDNMLLLSHSPHPALKAFSL